MSKLIRKKEVIDCLLHTIRELQRKNEETYVCNRRVQRIHALKYAIHDIEAIPAADVQPVRHGRWEETHISLCKWIPEDEKEEGHSFYMAEMKCSCCKRYNTVTFVLTLNKPDFCQLCGTRMIMDGEIDE